jgi:DNA-binding beta-propeller fold protein YncE
MDKDYNIISIFGEQGDASGYFAAMKGIAVDSYGHIYIVDALFHTVQIFDINGNYLSNFGSQGRDDGKFLMPTGISIDSKNKIYIADSYNARIQVFQLLEDY